MMGRSLLSRAHVKLLLLFPIAIVLGGCGLHLHNAADEALARKADDAFKAADVGKYVEAERKVLQSTNERDSVVTRRNVLAERDLALILALDERQTVGRFTDRIQASVEELGYPSEQKRQQILNGLRQRRAEAMIARDAYVTAGSVAQPSFPPTDADKETALKTSAGAQAIFAEYQRAASQYFDDSQTLNITEGKIGTINKQLKHAKDMNSEIADELAVAKAQLKEAVEHYKQEAASGKKQWEELETSRQKVMDALAQFDKIAKKLEPLAKQIHMQDLLAQIRLEKLNAISEQLGKFLTAFSEEEAGQDGKGADVSTEAPPSDAETAGRVAAVLVDAGKEITESATRTKLIPLLFEQERLRLEVERTERMVARGAKRIALLERQRESCIAQGAKLVDALSVLKHASKDDDASIGRLMNSDQKEYVVHAIFVSTESIAVDKLRQEEIEVTLIALDHEEALDATEYALNLWKHMIGSPLEQLVGYHASGLTSEDIANLLHAAGMAGIAVGVNR